MRHRYLLAAIVLIGSAAAQPPGPPQPPRSGKAAAPVDFTGYWVSVISEDWRWRMVTPIKGDFASVPLNAEGQRVGNHVGPGQRRSRGAGLQELRSCRADARSRARPYHLGGRQHSEARGRFRHADPPISLHRQDAREPGGKLAGVLRCELGARAARVWKSPTRFRFSQPEAAPKDGLWKWSRLICRRVICARTARLTAPPRRLEEYFDYHKEPNGDEWFTVTTIVNDPVYLSGPFITSSDFKKQRDAAGWDPSPCTAK